VKSTTDVARDLKVARDLCIAALKAVIAAVGATCPSCGAESGTNADCNLCAAFSEAEDCTIQCWTVSGEGEALK
jgi:hypothetical protein